MTQIQEQYVPKNNWTSIINNVRYIASDPCGTQPWVMIVLAIPPALNAAAEIMSFGFSDLVIGYTHPNKQFKWTKGERPHGNLRAPGRLRKGRKFGEEDEERARPNEERRPGEYRRFRMAEERQRLSRDGIRRRVRGFEMPEIGNEIGRHAPGARLIKGLPLNRKAWWFWLPVDLAERALWWLLIADVAKDFTYEWASDIHKYACSDKVPRNTEGWYSMQWSGLDADYAYEVNPGPSKADRVAIKNITSANGRRVQYDALGYGHIWWSVNVNQNISHTYTEPQRVQLALEAHIWNRGWVQVDNYDQMIQPGGACSINLSCDEQNCDAVRTTSQLPSFPNCEGDVYGFQLCNWTAWGY